MRPFSFAISFYFNLMFRQVFILWAKFFSFDKLCLVAKLPFSCNFKRLLLLLFHFSLSSFIFLCLKAECFSCNSQSSIFHSFSNNYTFGLVSLNTFQRTKILPYTRRKRPESERQRMNERDIQAKFSPTKTSQNF